MSKTTRQQAVTFFNQKNEELINEYGEMVEGRLYTLVKRTIETMNAEGDYFLITGIIGHCFFTIENEIEELAEEYALKSSVYYLNEDRLNNRLY